MVGTVAEEGAVVASVVVVVEVVTSAVVTVAADMEAKAVRGKMEVVEEARVGTVGDIDETAGLSAVLEGVVGVDGTVFGGLTMLFWVLCSVNPLEGILDLATISDPTK